MATAKLKQAKGGYGHDKENDMGTQVHVDASEMDKVFPRVAPIGTAKAGWQMGWSPDAVAYSDFEDAMIFDCRCPVRSANSWMRAALIQFGVPFIEC